MFKEHDKVIDQQARTAVFMDYTPQYGEGFCRIQYDTTNYTLAGEVWIVDSKHLLKAE